MELSAIMNIHELAVNRTVKQRSDAQAKKDHEVVYGNSLLPSQSDVKNKALIGAITNSLQQHAATKEDARSETAITGNIVDICM